MKSKVILVGGFIEIVELCEQSDISIQGIIESNKAKELYSYPILCDDENAESLSKHLKKIPLVITPDKPEIRRKLFEYYTELDFHFKTLISNKSLVSKSATIDLGSVVQTGTHISSEAKIGKLVKINVLANIMHNVFIGDYTTIAPNAVVLGNVTIGNECYIGANATILPNVRISDKVIIGAGSVVTKDIHTPGVYKGIPAK